MSEVIFNDENFAAEVENASGVVLVDFFATWCGPCKMLAPVIEELAGEYAGKCKIGKLDVDQGPKAAQKYGVQSIPTILIFKDGQVVDTSLGFKSKDVLKEKINNVLV
ncbi:thioredoxin [Patescibacteria group bacterium]|nr:thioredoxin [Patescibacteria group bacterium]